MSSQPTAAYAYAPETDLGWGRVGVEILEQGTRGWVRALYKEGSKQGEEKCFRRHQLTLDAEGETPFR